ncbi:uncharacterized protein Z519_02150 [Cladophialophora bantiana CBS 173.52]|uniref:Uncharacterized protein n=1 Tax=Cladophialophora bantiana (strain ATCC 10958 / CBS 173.52 / CDC B-1940 / NIH 8579) TaxID=1442370 RepID=A0A0D2IJ08_CLAB1|nr:uncharacterized protein Z519_02150 [Cladophialophora bantiana CBS 173.52]KIW96759.1 hypothetical protein Z519_02150 [Cladophialophora bantiana CBS 173.52]
MSNEHILSDPEVSPVESRKNALHKAPDHRISAATLPTSTWTASLAPKKPSVEALIGLFETKDRLSRAPTIPFEHAFTSPSPFLRERYLTALKSQKLPSSDCRPEKAAPRRGLREEEIQFIEQALRRKLSDSPLTTIASQRSSSSCPAEDRPRIKVKASAQSISIIIPEGVKLPIVATIESAGSFELETQMPTSSVKERSEASGTTGGGPGTRGMSRRRNTFSERATAGAARDSESQEIIAGLGLPFLARVTKGRLNVSEASIPAAQSTDISAPGRVFIPAHQPPGGQPSYPLHDHSKEGAERERGVTGAPESLGELQKEPDAQAKTRPALDPQDPQNTAPPEIETQSEAEGSVPSAAEPSSDPLTKPEDIPGLGVDASSKAEYTEPFSIPEIRIHRPSGTVMAASLGTTATGGASESPTPVQSATEQSATTTPLNAASNPVGAAPAPTSFLVKPVTVTNTVPVNAVTSAQPLAVSGLPLRAKLGKRKRVIRKVRRVVVRKHLLAIILGRDLANAVHPRLNTAGKTVPDVPLPLDGPSDLSYRYARRKEYKRDIQQRQMDQEIASARLHVEAEEIHRCSRCRGLKRTKYLRKYHRLQLQRDSPTMNVIQRHAISRARVARFKCKCNGRLRGAKDGKEARDPAVPAAPRHLQAPAHEAPLLGPMGNTLR